MTGEFVEFVFLFSSHYYFASLVVSAFRYAFQIIIRSLSFVTVCMIEILTGNSTVAPRFPGSLNLWARQLR